MKNIFEVPNTEKLRILNLHETSTRRQYLLKEQGVISALSDPSNLTLMTPDFEGDANPCLKPNSGKNKVSALLTYCTQKVQANSDMTKIKSWNERLYKAMKGLGTSSDFIKVLTELRSINDLATIWKTFKYDGENLWEWMEGESTHSWDKIWETIPANVKSVARIPECLEYNPSVYG